MPEQQRHQAVHPKRKRLVLLGGIVLSVLVIGSAGAILLSRQDSDEKPLQVTSPEPSPETSSTPTPMAREVPIDDLVAPGTEIEETLYGDLDGTPPEEIIVHSVLHTPDDPGVLPDNFVEVFSWDGSGWRVSFDASTYIPPGEDGPIIPGEWDELVGPIGAVDFLKDGQPEIVLPVTPVGASGGPLTVYIVGWEDGEATIHHTETTTRGGRVKIRESTVLILTGHYEESDPLCCPSGTERILLGRVGDGVALVSSSIDREESGDDSVGATPETVAAILLTAWRNGDRDTAGDVATAEAIDSLFRQSPEYFEVVPSTPSCDLDGDEVRCIFAQENDPYGVYMTLVPFEGSWLVTSAEAPPLP